MLRGFFEFRGYEEKTSGKGNRYLNLFAEDCDNGQAVRMYIGSNLIDKLDPPVSQLEKGQVLNVVMNYHQQYGGSFGVDVVDYEVE